MLNDTSLYRRQDLSPIDCMAVWANAGSSLSAGRSQTWSNHTFTDVAWRYADGMALQFLGLGGRFDNCVWEWNSWTYAIGTAHVHSDGLNPCFVCH